MNKEEFNAEAALRAMQALIERGQESESLIADKAIIIARVMTDMYFWSLLNERRKTIHNLYRRLARFVQRAN